MVETKKMLKSGRDGKNTQKNCIEKIFMNQITTMLQLVSQSQTFWGVKWALRSTAVNKDSGCDEIPGELFKSLKEDAIKVLHSLCQQIWKTQQWPQDLKRSILIPIPKKGNTKECANHQTIALISYAIKVMLKILHARFNIT